MNQLQEELLSLLLEDRQITLYSAVLNKTTNELSSANKDALMKYGQKVRKNREMRIKNALLEVSSSGWGNESETTIPGAVNSSSERR
ncbi:hypothetical protein [Shewanella algicola]|uniref:hypothetical protein n=1 Tax=Shewanella algicola TaxID=640633 RepID=UPI002494CD53|nr:hypothetical protein [Shewanella algicola]